MKIQKATINVMVCSCRATKSGKGYMLACIQGEAPFNVFSKRAVEVRAPQYSELTVDINCYFDKSSGELKEFISVAD